MCRKAALAAAVAAVPVLKPQRSFPLTLAMSDPPAGFLLRIWSETLRVLFNIQFSFESEL
jgi:hypothetical protein